MAVGKDLFYKSSVVDILSQKYALSYIDCSESRLVKLAIRLRRRKCITVLALHFFRLVLHIRSKNKANGGEKLHLFSVTKYFCSAHNCVFLASFFPREPYTAAESTSGFVVLSLC